MSLINRRKQFKQGDLMSAKEVAELLRVSPESIRTGIVGNFTKIPLTDSGKPAYVFLAEEVQAFIRRQVENASGTR